jgi:hypothetical protein
MATMGRLWLERVESGHRRAKSGAMFYRLLLDCRPSGATTSQPFITIKFVDADSQGEALRIATERTKALMKEKGLADAEIATFEFAIEEIEPFDRDEAVFETERSFVYYSDG